MPVRTGTPLLLPSRGGPATAWAVAWAVAGPAPQPRGRMLLPLLLRLYSTLRSQQRRRAAHLNTVCQRGRRAAQEQDWQEQEQDWEEQEQEQEEQTREEEGP